MRDIAEIIPPSYAKNEMTLEYAAIMNVFAMNNCESRVFKVTYPNDINSSRMRIGQADV